MTPLEELRALAPPCFASAWGDAEWQRLERRFEQPKRHYHTLHHVLALARAFSDLAGQWMRPDEVFGAILLHDAVYYPLRSDNEEQSARLSQAWLAEVGCLDVGYVGELIRLTAAHGSQTSAYSGDAALFLDLDMSILGASHAAYRAYAEGVAAEYSSIPGWLFRRKRRAFLEKLRTSPRIFLTDLLEARLGDAARANLTWELSGFPRRE